MSLSISQFFSHFLPFVVTQIARSSEEQSEAITQINTGIEQVSQVIQLNSATSEESAAAADEMSNQADMLTQAISQFKLKDTGRHATRPPAGRQTQKRAKAAPDMGTLSLDSYNKKAV